MTPLDLEQIYKLLPMVYRVRDAQAALEAGNALDPTDYATLQSLLAINGPLTPLQQQTLTTLQDKQQRGPLKSLMAILAEQIEVLQDSLYQSYDDLFIETCAGWVVPYIADLVGLQGLKDVPNAGYSVRAAVAETIANRRRKGTVPVLESIAREVTEWDANVVEFFQVLSTTQFMNHIRPANISVADIRKADWKLLNTPFDTYARTAEMRSVETRKGKYNIPNIGIFLWRLQQQHMEMSPACQIDAFRYTFDPIGRSIPLFTLSATESANTPRATPLNVAMPISRYMLAADLKHASNYYGTGNGQSLYVMCNGGPATAVAPVRACNLADVTVSGHVVGWAHQPLDYIAIDPQLGRIAFPSGAPAPVDVQANYCYGFSMEMGGGPYSRVFSTSADVSIPANAATLQEALALALPMLSLDKTSLVIEITDNQFHIETPVLQIPDKCSLEIRAKDGNRPVLVLDGDMMLIGGASSTFTLNGLLIAGGTLSVTHAAGENASSPVGVTLSHCTINPGTMPAIGAAQAEPVLPSLYVEAANIAIVADHCILGTIRIGSGSTVSLTTCIVDASSPTDVAYACCYDATGPGSPLTVVTSTIIGKVHTQQMTLASNSIFYAALNEVDAWTTPVVADQLQQGCVRFCYVEDQSRLPRCFHCYPVSGQASSPVSTSLSFSDPGYCQLADSAGLILTGADDQSEIGVFHDVYQAQRLSNLNVMIADYLRFGMEAGVFFAT